MDNGTPSSGWHAICLVGFDDSRQAFKFINSWGFLWGLGGYGYISYDMFLSRNSSAGRAFVLTDRREDVSEMFSGDFNGDGRTDYAAFRGAGRYTELVVWQNAAGINNLGSPRVAVTSNDFEHNKIKNRIAVGDFNGDGIDDVAAIYEYTNNQMGIWLFQGRAAGTFYHDRVCYSNNYDASKVTGRVTAGDYNGDGKDELAAFYDYGNNLIKLWRFTINANYATAQDIVMQSTWFSAPAITGTVTSGDYNGDGKDDIAAFYDYGNNRMGLWKWEYSGPNSMVEKKYGESKSFNATKIAGRVASGDANDDGRDDIMVMYNYGNRLMKLWMFPGVAALSIPHDITCVSNDFDAARVTNRFIAADFSGDGKCDVDALYNYSEVTYGMFRFYGNNNYNWYHARIW